MLLLAPCSGAKQKPKYGASSARTTPAPSSIVHVIMQWHASNPSPLSRQTPIDTAPPPSFFCPRRRAVLQRWLLLLAQQNLVTTYNFQAMVAKFLDLLMSKHDDLILVESVVLSLMIPWRLPSRISAANKVSKLPPYGSNLLWTILEAINSAHSRDEK